MEVLVSGGEVVEAGEGLEGLEAIGRPRLLDSSARMLMFLDPRPRRSFQDATQQDHRREAPRPRTTYHWTLRSWCGSHEGFEVKTPV